VTGRRWLALGLVTALAAGCAAPRLPAGTATARPRHARPALDTDEAGLWMAMDRAETTLRHSGQIVDDAALTDYTRRIVCRLAPAHCDDLRVYVVRTPQFNAMMAPNGVMQVWTGLILRVDNEAQLAYVLGHEIGHYLQRHSLQRWRDARRKGDLLAFFSIGAAAGGVGFVTPLVQLATLASIYAFSRDNEREADEIGLELMAAAGYDPREAPAVWEALVKERDAGDGKQPLLFFSTHPPTEERVGTLRTLGNQSLRPDRPGIVGREEYLAATLPHRALLLRDELRRRDFKRTAVLLERLQQAGTEPGQVHFFQGEMYRLRNEEGDAGLAARAYERAIVTGEAPPEAYRSLGLVLMKQDDRRRAREAFTGYLERQPAADDRPMIQKYLERLE
jgi:Zn-dependent protease with chaperone function